MTEFYDDVKDSRNQRTSWFLPFLSIACCASTSPAPNRIAAVKHCVIIGRRIKAELGSRVVRGSVSANCRALVEIPGREERWKDEKMER